VATIGECVRSEGDAAGSARVAIAFFSVMYFIQSVGDPTAGIIAQPVRSLLKSWGDSPAEIAGLMALLALPWSFKPLFGLISDFLPLFGSRRRYYLLSATAGASLGLLLIALVPLPPDSHWPLVCLLLLPTVGIAFGDVVVDALMVEKGQPLGLTGRFQSAQWAAAYLALLLTGLAGGAFAQQGRPELAFLTGALLWAVAFGFAWNFARDGEAHVDREDLRLTSRAIAAALRSPAFLTLCGIMFLWTFNPMWVSVLYLHMTETLGYSEQAYGNTYALFFAGCLLGSLGYALYCRAVRLGALLHLSILAGAIANAVYWDIANLHWAYAISFAAGVAYVTGMLIQLDLAARIIPARAAATLFATVMAVTNLAASGSEALGGWLYGRLSADAGPVSAFHSVVIVSVLFACSCWLLVPLLRKRVPDWWHRPAQARNAMS
jgi:MFS family permease